MNGDDPDNGRDGSDSPSVRKSGYAGSAFDHFLGEDAAMSSFDLPFKPPEGEVFGRNEAVPGHWPGQQLSPDTCAIRAQQYVIQLFTGEEIDKAVLIEVSRDNEWYIPGEGTPIQHMGRLLELHDIPVNYYERSNIFHLADELSQGHKVIVAIDGRELWDSSNPFLREFHRWIDNLGMYDPNHAVIVSGIDTTDPGNPHVIISDPGTGEAAARYPLERFIEAWRDSNFTMVATTTPPPIENCPELENLGVFQAGFDQGVLYRVAGMPFMSYLQGLWQDVGEPGEFLDRGPNLGILQAGGPPTECEESEQDAESWDNERSIIDDSEVPIPDNDVNIVDGLDGGFDGGFDDGLDH